MTIVHERWQETQSAPAEPVPARAATLTKATLPARSSASTGGAPHAAPRAASHRDATIDAVRAVCLFVVVVLHSLMVGVEVGIDGGLETSVALSGQPWFAPITWLLQIMPLFFIAGGFASLSQWRRMQARGASAAEYVLGRIRRLTVPALLLITTVGGAMLVLRALGADPALLAEASLRIGQPLWFLAVYLGVTSIVPLMARLHERWQLSTLAVLGSGIVLVDVLHGQLGLPVGYLNLLLVWPFMQQLGFVLVDGGLASWSRRALCIGGVTPLACIAAVFLSGRSLDMIENLNPPTVLIALLGIAQFFLLQLFRPRLNRITRIPGVARAAQRTGALAMTTYLWHMPLILVLVSVLWLSGAPLPEPHSVAWWLTRVPWLLGVALCVMPFAVWFVTIEERALVWVKARIGEIQGVCEGRTAGRSGRGKGLRAASSVLCAIAGTIFALLGGFAHPSSLVWAVAFTVAAVVLTGEPRLRWAQPAEFALMKGRGSTGSPLTRNTR